MPLKQEESLLECAREGMRCGVPRTERAVPTRWDKRGLWIAVSSVSKDEFGLRGGTRLQMGPGQNHRPS